MEDFKPNLTPKFILHNGFGGTYFRDIYNHITKKKHVDTWKFLPTAWISGLDIKTEVASKIYHKDFNKYKVKCGSSYDYWIEHGWIKDMIDSHGWVHWFCRYKMGRRLPVEDERQIKRWLAITGPKGRFRRNLCNKIWIKSKKDPKVAMKLLHDYSIAPAIRQTLLHWAYELTSKDLKKYIEDQL